MSVNEKMTALADAIRDKTGDTAKLSLDEMVIAIENIPVDGEISPIYDGEYTVIPKVNEDQTLETSGYLMANDVTVKQIPFFEVKNTAGGLTATIG